MVNYVLTNICQARICLQTTALYESIYVDGCNINMLPISSVYTKFFGQTKYIFTLQGEFNINNSLIRAQDNPHTFTGMGINSTSTLIHYIGVVWNTVMGSSLLPIRLRAQ
jgi:hypothetical protein